MVKRLIGTAVVLAVGAVVFYYMRGDASERVRAEAVKIADTMQLTNEQRSQVRSLINTVHDQAFGRALDLTRGVGSKFDGQLYFDELCRLVVERAREEHNDALADKFDEERKHVKFSVTER